MSIPSISPRPISLNDDSYSPRKQMKTASSRSVETSPTKQNNKEETTLTPLTGRLSLTLTSDIPTVVKRKLFAPSSEERRAAFLQKTSGSFGDIVMKSYPTPTLVISTGTNTAGGSYFVDDNLVVKPAKQDLGAPYNMQVTNDLKAGVPPGMGPVHERGAWVIQKALGADFSVPPIAIIDYLHERFGNPKNLPLIQLQEILAKFRIEKTYEELSDVRNQVGFARSLLDEKQKDLLKRIKNTELRALTSEAQVSEWLAKTDNLERFVKCMAYELRDFLAKREAHNDAIIRLEEIIARNMADTTAELVSAQQLIPDCEPLDSLRPKERESIHNYEFEKLLLDVLICNLDRQIANILVTGKRTLVLIDHSYTLPDPCFDNNFAGLRDPVLEITQSTITEYKAIDNPVQGPLKAIFQKAKAETLIEALKEDLALHQEEFASFSDLLTLPTDFFPVLTVNLLAIQKAIELNCPMRKIFAFIECPPNGDSPLILCLRESLDLPRRTLDKAKVDTFLTKFFSAKYS